MVYTYLLKSIKSGNFYVGISKDPRRRLDEHNGGRVSVTKLGRPWNFVYFKPHKNYVEARKHEKWLKKKNHEYKNKLAGQAATRYFDELEQEGKVRQVGKTGRYVNYERI